jgi:hypothetical protein
MKFLNHEVVVGHPFEKREGLVNLLRGSHFSETNRYENTGISIPLQKVSLSS